MSILQQCEEWFKSEGLHPEFMEGVGLMVFHEENLVLFLDPKEDPSFFCAEIRLNLSLFEGLTRNDILEAASIVCARKVVKAFICGDCVILATEILLDTTPRVTDVIPRMLRMLSQGVKVLKLTLKQSQTIIGSLRSGSNTPIGNSVSFISAQHTRWQSGVRQSTEKANRSVKIEKNVNGEIGYSVTILNTDPEEPLAKVQMATKPMKVISLNGDEVELRGYGHDERAMAMGVPFKMTSFANYGLAVSFSPNGEITKCTLILHDTGGRIEYI